MVVVTPPSYTLVVPVLVSVGVMLRVLMVTAALALSSVGNW